MPGIDFNDLLPQKKNGPITFDDLKPQGNDAGAGNAFMYGVSGGQIPFGNVITSGIGAAGAKAYDTLTGQGLTEGKSTKDLYLQSLADTKATQDANPNATLAGNIVGAVSTIPAAFSKMPTGAGPLAMAGRGLKGVSDFAGKVASVAPFKGKGIVAGAGNLATRMAGGAAVAAPAFGAYKAGESEPGQRLDAFKEGMGTGAVVGAALPVAGAVVGGIGGAALKGTKNAITGATARSVDDLREVAQTIRDSSSEAYSKMRDAGAILGPQATQNIALNLTETLKKDGALNPRLHDKVLAVYDDIQQAASKGAIGLEELDQWRQVLGDIAGNLGDKVNGRKAKLLMNGIDDIVNNVAPSDLLNGSVEAIDALKSGRALWAKQSKFNSVVDVINKSGGDANKLKRDLEKMLIDPRKTRGWSEAEKMALKDAARQTTGEGLLKMVGKFGFDLGSNLSVGNTALPAIGGVLAGTGSGIGAGALVPVVGTAARSTQKAIARGKAENLLKIIEQGGNITGDLIDALPQTEKKKFLSSVMQMPVAQASAILENMRKR